MNQIHVDAVQQKLDSFTGDDVYLHLETTRGAYASHNNEQTLNAGAYIRNGRIRYSRGTMTGPGPYRIGLKMDLGWVYAEGLTHYDIDEQGRLILAGHDSDGKLAVALQLSREPF